MPLKYLDSSRSGEDQSLGAWLRDQAAKDITAIRWQTGYFGADGLGFLLPVLGSIPTVVGLIGSNGGETLGSDVHRLVRDLGLPRPGVRLGVVRVEGGLFHPKVVHVLRIDGTAAAYVGSANLSARGVSGTNVEAGVTIEGPDAAHVLNEIAATIDDWFNGPDGAIPIKGPADVDALVVAGDLAQARPPRPPTLPRAAVGGATPRPLRRRAPLIGLPTVPPWLGAYAPSWPPATGVSDGSATPGRQAPAAPSPIVVTAPTTNSPTIVATWTKKLSTSDAQRKPTGNQRGSITLVKSIHPINAATYFRRDFFVNESWVKEYTATREPRETAHVKFDVTFLGRALGVLDIAVSFAPNREASQANYTSLLHLGPLATHIAGTDITGKWIEMTKLSDGSYTLRILPSQP